MSRKIGRALGRLVAADPLEDAGAVVQAVCADVHLGIRPVDELAVHPDRLGLSHQASPPLEWYSGSWTASIGSRPRQPHELGGTQRCHVGGRSCADPDELVPEQRPVDEDPLDVRQRERRDRAGLEAGCLLDLVGLGDARGRAARRERDLRRVRAAVARHEREHRLAVADEHERLHDLAERAAGRARGVLRGRRTGLELLEPRLGTGLSQEGGDSLDRLRPAWLHMGSVPGAADPNRRLRRCQGMFSEWKRGAA